MKIATWNVNSLRVRLGHLCDWLAANPVEVIGLQELKLTDEDFPREKIAELGLHAAWYGQKTYNGVAIISRQPLENVVTGIPGFDDPQRRVVAATAGGVRIVNVYVPNGQSVGSDKYEYKLGWLRQLRRYLVGELAAHPRLALLGDYNIAPEDRDVHDPAKWVGSVLVSEAERAAFRGLLDIGLADTFRLFEQPEASFSWWDYRMNAFRRNHGLRIDMVLASRELAALCVACGVDCKPRSWERPSDHAPVLASFNIASGM
jgi:exodeoxyribonuclease-3